MTTNNANRRLTPGTQVVSKTDGEPGRVVRVEVTTEAREFLRDVRAGQCLGLAAWAAKIIRAGQIEEHDLARCFALGFEG